MSGDTTFSFYEIILYGEKVIHSHPSLVVYLYDQEHTKKSAIVDYIYYEKSQQASSSHGLGPARIVYKLCLEPVNTLNKLLGLYKT